MIQKSLKQTSYLNVTTVTNHAWLPTILIDRRNHTGHRY